MPALRDGNDSFRSKKSASKPFQFSILSDLSESSQRDGHFLPEMRTHVQASRRGELERPSAYRWPDSLRDNNCLGGYLYSGSDRWHIKIESFGSACYNGNGESKTQIKIR